MPADRDKIDRLIAELDAATEDWEINERYHAAFEQLMGDQESMLAFVTELGESGRHERINAACTRYVESLAAAVHADNQRRMDAALGRIVDDVLDEQVRQALDAPAGDEPLAGAARQMAEQEAEVLREVIDSLLGYLVRAGVDGEELTEDRLRELAADWMKDPTVRELVSRAAAPIRFRRLTDEADD